MIRAVASSTYCALFRVGAGRRSDASDVPPPCLRVHASAAISPRLCYTLRCISGVSHLTMIRAVGRDVVASSALGLGLCDAPGGVQAQDVVASSAHCIAMFMQGRDFS
ncbi:hypothetical protein B0H14DRAFT_3500167 [Mycena olivaceomarginata]|nr:hypothetical protein B0H14DRAFT_3500167 [Mycena olivaceomarginata]